MLPLAPVRILVLGVLSWAILGTGLYYSYVAYEALTTTNVRPIPVVVPDVLPNVVPDVDSPSDLDTNAEPDLIPVVRQPPFPWTAITIAAICLAITAAGRLPVKAIFALGSDQTSEPRSTPRKPLDTAIIERPCGSRLYLEVHGREAGPTLILTHGWSLDSAAWKYMLPQLADRYRVVIWDLAGLGKSEGPRTKDYRLEKMASDLNAVINEVSQGNPVLLVGHSIGGMIQQTLCRIHPETLERSVSGLVFVHTTYTNPLNTNIAAGITRPLQPIIKLINDSMVPLEALYWLSNWQSYWNGTLHIAARFESFTGRQTWEQLDFSARKGAEAAPAVVARGNDGMLKFDEQGTLPNVQLPSLVISGNHDRLTVRSASEHIDQLLPHSKRLDDDGGHLGHLERTTEVAEAILDFADQALATQHSEVRV